MRLLVKCWCSFLLSRFNTCVSSVQQTLSPGEKTTCWLHSPDKPAGEREPAGQWPLLLPPPTLFWLHSSSPLFFNFSRFAGDDNSFPFARGCVRLRSGQSNLIRQGRLQQSRSRIIIIHGFALAYKCQFGQQLQCTGGDCIHTYTYVCLSPFRRNLGLC